MELFQSRQTTKGKCLISAIEARSFIVTDETDHQASLDELSRASTSNPLPDRWQDQVNRASEVLSHTLAKDNPTLLGTTGTLPPKIFEAAAQAIDDIRHVKYKCSQRQNISFPTEMSDALTRTEETGHSRLLDLSRGPNYSDAILWCFHNRHDEGGEGSLAYWPPSQRQLRNLTGLLGKGPKTKISLDTSAGGFVKSVGTIVRENRERAIRELGDPHWSVDGWSREIVSAALNKSGGGPANIRPSK
jgi:hypothetical protein